MKTRTHANPCFSNNPFRCFAMLLILDVNDECSTAYSINFHFHFNRLSISKRSSKAQRQREWITKAKSSEQIQTVCSGSMPEKHHQPKKLAGQKRASFRVGEVKEEECKRREQRLTGPS